MDSDPKAVKHCQKKRLKVNEGDISSQGYSNDFFDAITINHVIEHVHDPDKLLRDCHEKLKKGGSLVIATPNTENWQHRRYGRYWFQLDPPRHLHLFNDRNLEALVKRNGFTITRSFSSIRMDAWSTIVTRGVIRNGRFDIGRDKKPFLDVLIGIFHQYLSCVIALFKKNLGGEIILLATKH